MKFEVILFLECIDRVATVSTACSRCIIGDDTLLNYSLFICFRTLSCPYTGIMHHCWISSPCSLIVCFQLNSLLVVSGHQYICLIANPPTSPLLRLDWQIIIWLRTFFIFIRELITRPSQNISVIQIWYDLGSLLAMKISLIRDIYSSEWGKYTVFNTLSHSPKRFYLSKMMEGILEPEIWHIQPEYCNKRICE